MSVDLAYLPADLFGLTPVARAALAGRPRPAGLDVLVPAGLEDVPRDIDRHDADERAELAQALETRLAPFGPHVAALEAVRALREPGTLFVLAGQQPAYLGGPLYDVWKALHAVRLARALQDRWGRPVVAGFWNHADDHDIAEVHHLWVLTQSMELRKLGLPGESSGRRPLSQVVFDRERHGLEATAELLRNDLFVTPGLEGELTPFLPVHGESFSNGFTRLLLELFGAHGLVPIEPDWIRPQLSRHLAAVVSKDAPRALAAGGEALRAAGFEPAIEPTTAALLFGSEGGERRALRSKDGDYRYDDEPGSRTAAELAAEIVQAPERFSPGALLRPVVQDLALPTCAYVGGWGELAYHAQLGALRDACGAPRTAFVPRLSATLVDPETRASLAKLGASVEDVLRSGGEFGEDRAPAAGPAVADELRALGERTVAELAGLKSALAELDPGLGAQSRRAGARVKEALEKLAAKAERVHANSSGKGKRHLRRVNNGLVPRGQPQERVRGALEVLPRFGRAWMDEVLGEIDPLPTEHLIVQLIAEDEAPAGADDEGSST